MVEGGGHEESGSEPLGSVFSLEKFDNHEMHVSLRLLQTQCHAIVFVSHFILTTLRLEVSAL